MSVNKPTARPPINRQGTKTGRFDSRRPNVSQSPRPGSYGGGNYYDTTPTTTYYEENNNSGGYDNNDCGSNDSGSSDSGSCGSE